MGVNIYIRKLDGTDSPPAVEWWNSDRLSGDTALRDDETLEWVYHQLEPGTIRQALIRPADWQVFENWIASNIYEGGQRRWREAIEKMKADKSLWFDFIS